MYEYIYYTLSLTWGKHYAEHDEAKNAKVLFRELEYGFARFGVFIFSMKRQHVSPVRRGPGMYL